VEFSLKYSRTLLQLIEKYIRDVDAAVWNLDRLHSRLVESLDSNDRTTVRELLAEHMHDDNSLLNRAKPLLQHGQFPRSPFPEILASYYRISKIVQKMNPCK